MVVMPSCCGLFPKTLEPGESNAIPLVGCRVAATVRDSVAQVTVEQTFINNESSAIEAVYLFPIHPAGAVNHFEVTLQDGRKFMGVIKKKQEAKDEYEDALGSGQGAYLLEQTANSDEIFQSSVGNLLPGQQVTIAIGYVTIVENDVESDSLRFVVPTTIAPRYRPKETAESGKKQTVQPEYTVSVPYTVKLDLTFETSNKIKSVVSPSHQIETILNDSQTEAKVKFAASAEQLDRDIVVVLNGEGLDDPVILVEKLPDSDSVCAMLTFVPRFTVTEQKIEAIFLIDTSGSMSGFKVEQAKAALNLLIRSLPVDSYFNVYEFSDRFASKFPQSVKYSQETLREAVSFVDKLNADGGTELLPPLRNILSSELHNGYQRQIIVLTDGEVGNVFEIKTLARAHAKHVRIFTIGIGNAVSHELVDGLAKAANGSAVYILEDESFSKKVMQQLEHAVQPAFTGLKVEWQTNRATDAQTSDVQRFVEFVKSLEGDSDSSQKAEKYDVSGILKQAPFVSPPIFKGSRYTAFAIGPSTWFCGEKATVTGEDDSNKAFKMQVSHQTSNPRHTVTGSLLHAAAARTLIEELASKSSYLHLVEDVPQQTVDQVVETLSLTHNLVSSQTSFVCVEAREWETWRGLSVPERRNVPILGDKHGGDVPRIGLPCNRPSFMPMMMMCAMSAPPIAMRCAAMPCMATCEAAFDAPALEMCEFDAECDDALSAPPPEEYSSLPEEKAKDKDQLQTLLSWQLFDGSFTWCNELCEFTAGKNDQLTRDFADKFASNEVNVHDAWKSTDEESRKVTLATLLALAFLLTELADRKVEWNMLVDKAVAFLGSRFKRLSRAQYEQVARSFLLQLKAN